MGIRFTSGSSFLSNAGTAIDYTAPYTMSGWFIVDSVAGFEIFWEVAAADNALNNNEDFVGHNGTQFWGYHDVGGAGPNFGQTTGTVAANTWVHLAAVVNGTTVEGFVNGVSGGAANLWAGWDSRPASDYLGIGKRQAGSPLLNGSASYLKAWQAALTPAELLNEMRCGLPLRTTNLAGFWPLFDVNDVNDYSGNGKNFTATSCATGPSAPIPFSFSKDHRIYIPTAAVSRRIFLIS